MKFKRLITISGINLYVEAEQYSESLKNKLQKISNMLSIQEKSGVDFSQLFK